MIIKKCPKCGGTTFYVTQDWKSNCYGVFFEDDSDIWECADCGYFGAGKEFNCEYE